jgi:hypothetical protein
VPSIGTQALTALRFSKITLRSVARSRTIRELGERLELDRLFEIVDQGGAGHAGASVDEHGAGAADFFEAIRVVGDGRGGGFAVAGDGIRGDLHQAGDHVHTLMVGEFELFPVRLGSGIVLALDFDDDGFISH